MKHSLTPLKGIIPPMITPLNHDMSLDLKRLDALLDHLIHGGVHGIFILGTTGECTNISYEMRVSLIKKTCQSVDDRVPVLVGITDTSLEESLRLGGVAKSAGASALVAAPPYYYGLGAPELEDYFKKLADLSPLPLFLYNMPSHTKTMISQSTVLALSKHPNIYGLKDSSGNGVYFNAMLYAFRNDPDFSLLVGPEEMMASVVLMGASGGVSGGANMFPRLYVDLYQAAERGDMEEVAILQEMVMEISSEIYGLGSFGSSFLKGLKAALSVLGIAENNLAPPFTPFDDQVLKSIKSKIFQLKAYKKYGGL